MFNAGTGKQGLNAAQTTRNNGCRLAGWICKACPSLLIQLRIIQSVTTQRGWTLPLQSLIKKMLQSGGGTCQLRPPSQMGQVDRQLISSTASSPDSPLRSMRLACFLDSLHCHDNLGSAFVKILRLRSELQVLSVT